MHILSPQCHVEIPASSFLHTVAVEVERKVQYATFFFGRYDLHWLYLRIWKLHSNLETAQT